MLQLPVSPAGQQPLFRCPERHFYGHTCYSVAQGQEGRYPIPKHSALVHGIQVNVGKDKGTIT